MTSDNALVEPAHFGCVIPADLLYDVEMDVWIREEGQFVYVGMTDPAQTRCGKLVAVNFRRLGKMLERGRGLASIESAKWVGPVPTPVTGELVEVNSAAFDEDILIANRDPYGAGWLVKIRPTMMDVERPLLATGEEAFASYREIIDRLEMICYRCAD